MITDKEVGETWAEINKTCIGWGALVIDLIDRLIEERAERFYLQNKYGWDWVTCHKEAATSFNLDPSEYKKAKS